MSLKLVSASCPSTCGPPGPKGDTAFAKVAGQTTRHNYFLVANCCDPTNPDVVYYNPAELVVNPMDADLDGSGYALFNAGSITPLLPNTYDLGTTGYSWRDLYLGTSGGLIIGQNSIVSSVTTNQLNVSGDWLPIQDITYSLGTTTQRWLSTQTTQITLSDPSATVFNVITPSGDDILVTQLPGGTVYSLLQNPGPQGANGNPPTYEVLAGPGLTGGGITSTRIGSLTVAMNPVGTIGITTINYPASVTTDTFGRITSAVSGATFRVNAGEGLTGGGVFALGTAGPTLSLPIINSGVTTTTTYPSSVTIDPYGRITSITGGATFRVNAGEGLTGGGVFALGTAGPTLSLPIINSGVTTTTTYPSSVTIDPYGRITGITGGATYAVNIGAGVTGNGGVFLLGSAGPTLSLATVGAGATSVTYPSAVTVNQYGQITSITGGATYRVNAGAGLTGGGVFTLGTAGPTISMPSIITAGTTAYPTSVTVDQFGRVTAITGGAQPVTSIVSGGSGIIVTGSAPGVTISYFSGGVQSAAGIGITSYYRQISTAYGGAPGTGFPINGITELTANSITLTPNLSTTATGRIEIIGTFIVATSNNSPYLSTAVVVNGVTGPYFGTQSPNNNSPSTSPILYLSTVLPPNSYQVKLAFFASQTGRFGIYEYNIIVRYHL